MEREEEIIAAPSSDGVISDFKRLLKAEIDIPSL
jgi:hypothetical protein